MRKSTIATSSTDLNKKLIPQERNLVSRVLIDTNGGKDEAQENESPSKKVDPTRYGDWERNGRCIDF